MSITGLPGQGPVRVGIPIADLAAGLFCALGILVALLEREKSGEGQWVQTSLLAGADLHARFPGRALADRTARCRSRPATIIRPASRPACSRPPTATSTSPPPGRRSGSGSARAIEAPDAHAAAGLQDRRRALAAIATRSTPRSTSTPAKRTSAEWIERLNAAGVPCGPIYSIDQVFADPQVEHLGIATERRERRTRHAAAWSASRCRCRARRARSWRRRPSCGEHTDEVLRNSASSPGDRRAAQANAI